MKRLTILYLICIIFIFLLPVFIVQLGHIGIYDNLNNDFPISKLKSTGKIKVYIKAEDKVADMELEEYIRGVLAAEMPASFPLEALKAQAVAARSYVISRISNDKGDVPEHKGAQMCTDFAHCQAWISKEERLEKWDEKDRVNFWNKITAAVQDTAGEIMVFDNKPVSAVFCAISSGKTERAADVWGSDISYLQSVDSPYDKNAPGYETKVELTLQEFKDKLITSKSDVKISDNPGDWYKDEVRTEGGGVSSCNIGGVTLKGTEVRTIFGLRSINYTLQFTNDKAIFDVKGYGHGVGMSQWGAKYYAEDGKNYKDILKLYYNGISFNKITK